MQNQVTVFRTMIAVSIALSTIGGFIDLVFPGLVPDSVREAYEAYTALEVSLPLMLLAGFLSLAVFGLGIAAIIGLLLLQRWARSLALWSTAVSMLIYPLLGALVQSGVAATLLSIATLLWGAALAMTYYSDLKSHFQRPQQR